MLVRLIPSPIFIQSLREVHKKLGVSEDQTFLSISPDGALLLLRKSPNAALGVDGQPLAGYSYTADTWVPRSVS